MSNEKQYIGKGKQKPGSEFIVLHLDLNAIQNAEFTENEGRCTMKVIVAKLRTPDRFQRTHTVYVPVKDSYPDLKNQMVADQQELELWGRED